MKRKGEKKAKKKRVVGGKGVRKRRAAPTTPAPVVATPPPAQSGVPKGSAFGVESRSPETLPHAYGESRIVAMARDPHWAHAYWEVTAEALEEAKERIGEGPRLTLRIHPADEGHHFDIEAYHRIGNWYIEFWSSGKNYWIEIGLKSRSGAFASIARSNLFSTPAGALSWRTDEEWLEVGDDGEPKAVAVEGIQGVPAAQIERMVRETEAAVSSWFVRPA